MGRSIAFCGNIWTTKRIPKGIPNMRYWASIWLCLAILVLGAQPKAMAGDWPGWLGPKRDSSSPEVIVPWALDLSPMWKISVGEGHSSPVIHQGRAYLHFKTPAKEAETLLCVSLKEGKTVWETSVERNAFSNSFGNGPRATPLIHGNRIYTFGASGQVACHSINTALEGKVVWKRDLLKEFDGKNLFFGASASPLISGNALLIPVGGKDAAMVALDIKDGSTLWKSIDDRATYASPVILDNKVIFLSQKGLQALSLADGKPLGHFPLVDKLNESATTPVETPHGIFVSSVTYGGAFVDKSQGSDFLKPIWKSAALSCYFSTPVASASGEELYMVTGSIFPPPSSTLRCIDTKTGKVLWSRPKSGKYHAALLRLGDGNMLLVDDYGLLRLFKPSREKFQELAVSKLCGATWAHPALSGGTLVIRDEQSLLAVQLPTK